MNFLKWFKKKKQVESVKEETFTSHDIILPYTDLSSMGKIKPLLDSVEDEETYSQTGLFYTEEVKLSYIDSIEASAYYLNTNKGKIIKNTIPYLEVAKILEAYFNGKYRITNNVNILLFTQHTMLAINLSQCIARTLGIGVNKSYSKLNYLTGPLSVLMFVNTFLKLAQYKLSTTTGNYSNEDLICIETLKNDLKNPKAKTFRDLKPLIIDYIYKKYNLYKNYNLENMRFEDTMLSSDYPTSLFRDIIKPDEVEPVNMFDPSYPYNNYFWFIALRTLLDIDTRLNLTSIGEQEFEDIKDNITYKTSHTIMHIDVKLNNKLSTKEDMYKNMLFSISKLDLRNISYYYLDSYSYNNNEDEKLLPYTNYKLINKKHPNTDHFVEILEKIKSGVCGLYNGSSMYYDDIISEHIYKHFSVVYRKGIIDTNDDVSYIEGILTELIPVIVHLKTYYKKSLIVLDTMVVNTQFRDLVTIIGNIVVRNKLLDVIHNDNKVYLVVNSYRGSFHLSPETHYPTVIYNGEKHHKTGNLIKYNYNEELAKLKSPPVYLNNYRIKSESIFDTDSDGKFKLAVDKRNITKSGTDLKLLNIENYDLMELLENIKNNFKSGKLSKLVILAHGGSGTGKTQFASKLAEILKFKFKHVTYGCLSSKWIGESERNLRQLFTEQTTKTVLLLDEVDSIGSARTRDSDYNKLTNELLVNLENRCKGIVILATNFLDDLDNALLRRINLKLNFLDMKEEAIITYIKRSIKTHGLKRDMNISDTPKMLKGCRLGDFGLVDNNLLFINCTKLSKYVELVKHEINIRTKNSGDILGFKV